MAAPGGQSSFEIAVAIVSDILQGRPTEKAMKSGLKRHRANLPDNAARALVARRVLGTACFRRRLEHLVAHVSGSAAAAGEARWLVAMYIVDVEHGALEAPLMSHLFTDEDADMCAAFLEAPRVWPDSTWPDDDVARLAVDRSLPDWIARTLVDALGVASADAVAAASNVPGPVTLRVNLLTTTRGELAEALEKEGMTTTPTRASPWGLHVLAPAKPNIWGSNQWRNGCFEVQDEGSQLIALACTERGALAPSSPAPIVVDLCCGRGGKSLVLAMLLPSTGGVLLTHDIDPNAIRDLGVRARRAKATHCVAMLSSPDLPAVAAAAAPEHGGPEEGADVVLVDAPCSRLGILRRGPGSRWEIPDVTDNCELEDLQFSLLLTGARLLRPGGVLVYATCTLRKEENEAVSRRFIAAAAAGHCPRMSPSPLAEAFGEGGGDVGVELEGTAHELTLVPGGELGTDGFYMARFRRDRAR